MRKALAEPRTREKAARGHRSRQRPQKPTRRRPIGRDRHGAGAARRASASSSRPSRPRSTAAAFRPRPRRRRFAVEADIFSDGHDKIDAALLIRRAGRGGLARGADGASSTTTAGAASSPVDANARYATRSSAWRDLFASWRDEVAKKHAAGVPIALELIEGPHARRARRSRRRPRRRRRPRSAGGAARRGSRPRRRRRRGSRALMSQDDARR